MRCEPGGMALLGSYSRTIHTHKRPETRSFLLQKLHPAEPASFEEPFRATRVVRGYTEVEMARKFGVSLSTVKFWEQNRTEPKPTVRYHVEAFLKSQAQTTAESAQHQEAA
jgi:DNA-binding transcriptional regulator YiaG